MNRIVTVGHQPATAILRPAASSPWRSLVNHSSPLVLHKGKSWSATGIWKWQVLPFVHRPLYKEKPGLSVMNRWPLFGITVVAQLNHSRRKNRLWWGFWFATWQHSKGLNKYCHFLNDYRKRNPAWSFVTKPLVCLQIPRVSISILFCKLYRNMKIKNRFGKFSICIYFLNQWFHFRNRQHQCLWGTNT